MENETIAIIDAKFMEDENIFIVHSLNYPYGYKIYVFNISLNTWGSLYGNYKTIHPLYKTFNNVTNQTQLSKSIDLAHVSNDNPIVVKLQEYTDIMCRSDPVCK